MAHLTLAGASDDGRRLVLVDDEGTEHSLEVTAALRSAVGVPERPARPGPSRPGQLEKKMDSVLRPRDIQARIRAGESAEEVAEAAQTSVDRIMVYAGPVLAEREHVAQRAQRSSVRRSSGETGARTLDEAVAAHLRSVGTDPATVEWDAWRRDDGRWTLTGRFATSTREGTATFVFDAPGNYVVLDDEDARWLIGEVVAAPPGVPPMRDDLHERRRLLSSVPGSGSAHGELPLGVDAIELVAEPAEAAAPAEAADLPAAADPAATTDIPLEAFFDESAASDDPAQREQAADAAVETTDDTDPRTDAQSAPDPDQDSDADAEPPARRPVQKKRGRASVPSWDEIMFGGGDQ